MVASSIRRDHGHFDVLKISDLKEKGIVTNRVTLQRWIENGDFPAGIELGPNTRAWTEGEIKEWYERRRREGCR